MNAEKVTDLPLLKIGMIDMGNFRPCQTEDIKCTDKNLLQFLSFFFFFFSSCARRHEHKQCRIVVLTGFCCII